MSDEHTTNNSNRNSGNRRASDKLVNCLRIEALILLLVIPIVLLMADICKYDWHLTTEWVAFYGVGVVGMAATAFGLVKRNGNGK